ncbi:aconitate hydratase [Lentisphaera araneosa HTCC2155]|uniref:Aconitate hydratase n=1 Tax=Lentisphaera araneosa HTCC2155 TaxID=313628 RepID=A6DS03_9BACT|nr:hypothetical protein [Lentisphaera araneosa]EDM25578.1 aconitate hydratase [Lentisphaera araneosa HTCC2155]
MSHFLLKTFILIQLVSTIGFATEKEVKSLSDLIHKQMFVEKKKARQMSIIIDPLYADHDYGYQLKLKTFIFHDKSKINYDKTVTIDSSNQIDIPITFASKPIDIPVSLTAECTQKTFPYSSPVEFSLKDKAKQVKLPNGEVLKLTSINRRSFKFETPENFIFQFIAYDKKGTPIVETSKNEFAIAKSDKQNPLHKIKVTLKAQVYKKPLMLSLNFDSVYAKKLDTLPSDRFFTREDISKRLTPPTPSIITDEALNALNYQLIDNKIVLSKEKQAFSFKDHMNIINDESIVLLGKAYIKKLSATYLEEDFTKTIDLSKRKETLLAILKTRILAPSEQLKIEVTRKANKDSQTITIDDEHSLQVYFNENHLTYQFMKNEQVVQLSDITPFAVTFEAVYNKEGIALLKAKNNCYWGYPEKLVISVPTKAKTKVIDQVINLQKLTQIQEDQLLSNYGKIQKVAQAMASIHSISNFLPQENNIVFAEDLASLYYLNQNDSKVTTKYSLELVRSDPKGLADYKYQVMPYMGYYITVNNKIETSDSSFDDIQKFESSKDFSYNGDYLDFIGVKKKDWGLIAIPVDPTTMPHLYSNYEQYYKFFDKQQDAKPISVWKSGWSSL